MLRLRCSYPLGTGEVRACVGEDAAGRAWGWFEGQATSAQPTALPNALTDAEALRVLVHLPGWRLTRLARLELGGRVVIVGGGWLAQTTLSVCALRGCVWRASAHNRGTPLPADYVIASALPLPEALRRGVIPSAPDAVILTSSQPEWLSQATQLCRTGGTVVVAGSGWAALDYSFYPDVHKRGLHFVPVDTCAAGSGKESDEESLLAFSQAIVTAGFELP